jgi:hypothetical protein
MSSIIERNEPLLRVLLLSENPGAHLNHVQSWAAVNASRTLSTPLVEEGLSDHFGFEICGRTRCEVLRKERPRRRKGRRTWNRAAEHMVQRIHMRLGH